MLLGLGALGKYPLGSAGDDGNPIPTLVVSGDVHISVAASGYAEFNSIPTVSLNGAITYAPLVASQVFLELQINGSVSAVPTLSGQVLHGVAGSGAATAIPEVYGRVFSSLIHGSIVVTPLLYSMGNVEISGRCAVVAAPVVSGSITHSASTSFVASGAVKAAPVVIGQVKQGRGLLGAVSASPVVASVFGQGSTVSGQVAVIPSIRGRLKYSQPIVQAGAIRGKASYSPVVNATVRHGVSSFGIVSAVPVVRNSKLSRPANNVAVYPVAYGLVSFDRASLLTGSVRVSPSVYSNAEAGLRDGYLLGNLIPAKPFVQGVLHV